MAFILLNFDEKKLQRGFADIKKATFIATKNTLDTMAALSRKNAIKNVKSDFINRNTFTTRQIQFEKSSGTSILALASKVGATEKAPYMALQETGGERKTKNGTNLAIPTNQARGGSKTSLVNRSNYLKKIKQNKVKGKFKKNIRSSKSRAVAAAFVAHREKKFLSREDGIYTVSTFKKKKASGVKYNKTMIYNSKKRKTRVKSNAWLMPATIKPIQDGQAIFNSQVNKLLRKAVI